MSPVIDSDHNNPFLRYRTLLISYLRAIEAGWSDADFVSLVKRLDAAVADVDGHGFTVSPLTNEPNLAVALGSPASNLWIKNDTNNVGGSHKARHLFGVLLHLAVDAVDVDSELAIASCGNAALAAAVVARAEGRPLRVFIPTWADASIVKRLSDLEATVEICERRPGEQGDPTYLRMLEAVEAGAVPFSVQSTLTRSTVDGGRTLGWEIAEQLGDLAVSGGARVFLQIGGGAMAAAVMQGISNGIHAGWLDIDPIYHPVQTVACSPLRRAWDVLIERADLPADSPASEYARLIKQDANVSGTLLALAQRSPDEFMWPWEPVGESAADGILDDVTYDWLGVIAPTFRSGGWPLVVAEEQIVNAHRAVANQTDISASATGTAGLAGLLAPELANSIRTDENLIAICTGVER